MYPQWAKNVSSSYDSRKSNESSRQALVLFQELNPVNHRYSSNIHQRIEKSKQQTNCGLVCS